MERQINDIFKEKFIMDNPLISIIIPVYKAEEYLNRCLDSILAQTYTNWECLLIDDGSSDSSGSICDEYAANDSRFRVFHKENEGVSTARNLGLDNVKGEWVTFVDSDDELLKNALELYSNAISEYGTIDVIKGGYIKFYEAKNKELLFSCGYDSIENQKDRIVKRLNESSFYHGFLWNECINRNLINSFRFDVNLHWNEDNIFSYQCLSESNSVVFLSQPVYKYYVRKSISLSNINDPYMLLNSSAKILEYRLDMLGNNDLAAKCFFEKSYMNRFLDAAFLINKTDNENINKFKQRVPHLEVLKKDCLISIYLNSRIPNFISKYLLILKKRINQISNKIIR